MEIRLLALCQRSLVAPTERQDCIFVAKLTEPYVIEEDARVIGVFECYKFSGEIRNIATQERTAIRTGKRGLAV